MEDSSTSSYEGKVTAGKRRKLDSDRAETSADSSTDAKLPGGILFDKASERFVLFPIKQQAIWDMYKRAERSFWTTQELDFEKDIRDFNNRLNDNERHYVKHVLAFFASSDGIVNDNLITNMMSAVTLPEARSFYGFQIMIENIHAETYSMLIETYIRDPEEKQRLFNGITTIPCIQRKANWALQHIERGTFVRRLIAFAAVEGIFFSASFCAIFWLRKRGLMLGLAESNELISRDEGMHTDFACLLYSLLQPEDKLPAAEVHAIVREAVECEQEFVTDALPVSLIGMNAQLMCRYVEFVADRLLIALGYARLYNSANPFEWMEQISIATKSNIHERVSTEYARSAVSKEVRLDEAFD
jgi:ribonucleoside-diphosphate reductase beta chain